MNKAPNSYRKHIREGNYKAFYFNILFVSVLLLGCEKQTEEDVYINIVSEEEKTLLPSGGSDYVQMISHSTVGDNWEPTFEENVSWLEVNKNSFRLQIRAEPNNSKEERSVTILFEFEGRVVDQILIKQPKFSPYTIIEDDVNFNANTGVIESYTGQASDIIVPPNFNGIKITGIGERAFCPIGLQSTILTSVILSEGITSIGEAAFSHNQISYVILPESISIIEDDAFSNNEILNLVLNEGLTYLGSWAFSNNKIENLVIPSTLEVIENVSFGTNNLSKINIPNSIEYIGGGAFSGNNLTTLEIPSSVNYIGNNAFGDNMLNSITIPNTITFIGYGSFNSNSISEINGEASNGIIYKRNSDGSDDISEIISYGGTIDMIDFIPNNVKKIGERAFDGNNLTEIIIPKTVNSIGEYAFSFNNLTKVIIPSSIEYIGSSAFSKNELKSVFFEEKSYLKEISSDAFAYNDELVYIILPENANENFYRYKDSRDLNYSENDSILNLYLTYSAVDLSGSKL